MEADEKTCPFCAETIKAAAVVCKHCGKDLPTPAKPPTPDELLMAEHGITWREDRFMWRGVYFKHLGDAVNYATHNKDRVDSSIQASAATTTKPFKLWLWGPLSAVGLFVLWALVRTPSPEENARRRAEDVIAYCWKEQSRKSLDPAAARFAASACEKLTDDYRSKYGRNP
jgi:hypothetical protein